MKLSKKLKTEKQQHELKKKKKKITERNGTPNQAKLRYNEVASKNRLTVLTVEPVEEIWTGADVPAGCVGAIAPILTWAGRTHVAGHLTYITKARDITDMCVFRSVLSSVTHAHTFRSTISTDLHSKDTWYRRRVYSDQCYFQ